MTENLRNHDAELAYENKRMRAALEEIAGMFEKGSFGSTLLKPDYGYYDVLKTAHQGLKE